MTVTTLQLHLHLMFDICSVRCITSDDAEEAVYVRDIAEILNHLDVQVRL